MNEETLKNETRESKFVCPVCGQKFQDIVFYAAHLTEHSEEEKKRKADEAQKQREAKRKADIEKLELLYAEKVSATKKFEKALDEYRENYGGLTFPYRSVSPSLASLIDGLLNF